MRIHTLIAAAGFGIALTAGSAHADGKAPFPDVPTAHYAADAIAQLTEMGIVKGNPDGTYAGSRAITRYEFATAMKRYMDWVPGEVDRQVDLQFGHRATPPAGPRGPQGERGVRGPQGEQGPVGPQGSTDAADAISRMTREIQEMRLSTGSLRSSFEGMHSELQRLRSELGSSGQGERELQERFDRDRKALKYGPYFQHRGRDIPNNTRGTITDPLQR